MASRTTFRIPVTGYQVIDHYHRRLAGMMSEAAVLASSNDYSRFLAKVQEFRKYTASHFAQEEIIMRGTGYELLVTHHERHAAVLADIDRALASLEGKGGTANRFVVVQELERALFDHEIHYDADFHDFYERLGGTSVDWSDELLTGVAWADAQHKELFDIIKLIDQSEAKGLGQDTIRALLDRFVALVRRHFSEEEAELERRQGQPAVRHRAHHENELGNLGDLLAAFEDDSYAVLSADYLKFWLVDHIRRLDKPDLA